jgi:hypothetical protein
MHGAEFEEPVVNSIAEDVRAVGEWAGHWTAKPDASPPRSDSSKCIEGHRTPGSLGRGAILLLFPGQRIEEFSKTVEELFIEGDGRAQLSPAKVIREAELEKPAYF